MYYVYSSSRLASLCTHARACTQISLFYWKFEMNVREELEIEYKLAKITQTWQIDVQLEAAVAVNLPNAQARFICDTRVWRTWNNFKVDLLKQDYFFNSEQSWSWQWLEYTRCKEITLMSGMLVLKASCLISSILVMLCGVWLLTLACHFEILKYEIIKVNTVLEGIFFHIFNSMRHIADAKSIKKSRCLQFWLQHYHVLSKPKQTTLNTAIDFPKMNS